MPKGALLHCHFGATVDMNKLIEIALETPLMHMRIDKPFSPEVKSIEAHRTLELPTPKFLLRKADSSYISKATSLFDSDYNSNEWIPMPVARDNFHTLLGGPKGFDLWLYKSLTVDYVEAYQTHSTVTKVT